MPSAPSLALAFATLERPQVVQRLVLSARKYFPDLSIYVADQSRETDAMAAFYEKNRVTLLRMPYDSGVTAARNRLAQAIREDYFVLCDDDFVLGSITSFDDALRILAADPTLAVVGGRLFDFDGKLEIVRNWELYLEYDVRQKILLGIPIYQFAPRVREVGGVRYYLCDAVLNFAVFRRSVFTASVQWDERFKSNGEHEDFYLNLKMNTSFKVAHLPTMVAYHHHPEEYRRYRAELRERNEGWKLFFEKWDIEQYHEYGLGVRTRNDFNTVVPAETVTSRFFVNPDLSLHRADSQPGAIVIGDFEKIAAVGALSATGGRAAGSRSVGRLLLNPRTAQIVPADRHAPRATDDPAAPSYDSLAARYALQPEWSREAVSTAGDELFFRYDPVLRTDADFFLWYFCTSSRRRGAAANPRLSAVVRWTAADGSILVWKSRRLYLDLRPSGFWLPLLLDLPVLPRDCRWLRFDMVTDGGPSADPVCTGFLFDRSVAGSPSTEAEEASHVLGFGRLRNDGSSPGASGRPLDEIGPTYPKRRITPPRSAALDELSLLRRDELADLDVLYFTGWQTLGRNLVSARLPPATLDAPAALAVPYRSASRGRLYGFGRAAGFVALAWSE